ncbi:hypothetical protein, partial [Rhizobium sp. L1K21]|uniref:hypothetical protein n=1 Tax=Rhizobium sp. L1K21 TaxID=2954933 RepID=UPI002092B0BB
LPATSEDFPRAKEVVASSAAALVSDWAYRTTPLRESTTKFKKLSFFSSALILLGYFSAPIQRS